MITLLVNVYMEDPHPAIESAKAHLPIDRVCVLRGRYLGFPDLGRDGPVYRNEHGKRNALLELAGPPDPNRWLMLLDCDERVVYASPALPLQLDRLGDPVRLTSRPRGDVAGVRFVEPLQPDAPGLVDPRRGVRDNVIEAFPRLIRHVPGLEFRHRHDYLVDGQANVLMGWASEYPAEPEPVDVMVVHLRTQTPERVAAKEAFYAGPIRAMESTHVKEP